MNLCEQQFGFMQGKRTTDETFAFRMILKNREGQKELLCVFVDLENVHDRIQREKLRLG